MIYTITLNPSLDKIMYLKQLKQGSDNNAYKTVYDIGGKATHVSVILSKFKTYNVAMGFLGGRNGQMVEKMLNSSGVITDFIYDNAQTRLSTLLRVDNEEGSYLITNKGDGVSRESINKLFDKIRANLSKGDYVVVSGAPPVHFTKEDLNEMFDIINEKEAVLFTDIAKGFMQTAIDAKPLLIKPNLKEFYEYWNVESLDKKDIYKKMLSLNDMGIRYTVLSLGKDGCLLGFKREIYKFNAIDILEKNDTGCGDCFLAGIVYGLYNGYSIFNSLKIATSIASSKANHEGCAEVDLNQVREFYKNVAYKKIDV